MLDYLKIPLLPIKAINNVYYRRDPKFNQNKVIEDFERINQKFKKLETIFSENSDDNKIKATPKHHLKNIERLMRLK